jgi:hypothetical protein
VEINYVVVGYSARAFPAADIRAFITMRGGRVGTKLAELDEKQIYRERTQYAITDIARTSCPHH